MLSLPSRRLTKYGQQLKQEFDHLYKAEGCKCDDVVGMCQHCMHPGNPQNLSSYPNAWEAIPEETKADRIMDAIREMAGKGNT